MAHAYAMTPSIQYPKPHPHFWTLRFWGLLLPLAASVLAAGSRSTAGAYLISYWGWPEALGVACALEGANIAFLLRLAWAKNLDILAALGLLLAFLSSAALSALLAWRSIHDGLLALGAAYIASLGINAVDFLLARELSSYVIEFERAVSRWESDRQTWLNRRQARQYRPAPGLASPRSGSEQSASAPPRTKAERTRTLLGCYQSRPDWSTDTLLLLLNCKRTSLFALRSELVRSGRLLRTPEGFHAAEASEVQSDGRS